MDSIIHSVYYSNDISKKPSHYHDCHQIIFITEGSVEICVNNAKHIANSGDIIMFSRYESHSINVLSQKYERFVLRITPFAEKSDNKFYSLLSNRPSGFENIITISNNITVFKSIFNQIIEENSKQNQFSEEMLELLINELFILIYRNTKNISPPFEEENFKTVFQIQKKFETDYKEHHSLEKLAKEYNISPSTLSHQFKKITGSSVMNYLLSCRIAEAKKKLAKTNMNISEIVENCGFSDTSNFSRTFKSITGLTPSEFRKSTYFKNNKNTTKEV